MKISVLGCSGGALCGQTPTSFLINDFLVIDGGSLSKVKYDNNIEHIIITHTHLDHIRDLVFFIESNEFKKQKLNIWASAYTNCMLKKHIFNDIIWPDIKKFKNTKLNNISKNIKLKNLNIQTFRLDHVVPTFGLIIKEEQKTVIINGDGILPKNYTKLIKNHKPLMIFYETSFSSKYKQLAKQSKHLSTEDILEGDNIFLYHLKPYIKNSIMKELKNKKIQYLKQTTYYL